MYKVWLLRVVTAIGAAWFTGPLLAQQFQYVNSSGRAHVFLYGWNENRNEVSTLYADREALGLRVGANEVALSPAQSGVEVFVDIYARAQPRFEYCSDVRFPDQDRPITRLRGHSGQLTIILGEKAPLPARSWSCTRLRSRFGISYSSTRTGTDVSMKTPVTLKAVVGWVSG